MGRASTVTTVSTNRLRPLSSFTLAAISSCSSLMRSCSEDMSRSTTENSSVDWRSSCTSFSSIQSGGCCSSRNSAAGSGASRRCSRTSRRRISPRRARRCSSLPASSSSSVWSTRRVTPRTISTSTSACARIRCSSSAVLERKISPLRTVVRNWSTARRACWRAVTTSPLSTLIQSVEISDGSKAKSKCTSLMTAMRDWSARSMRVEYMPSFRVSKKVSDRFAWRASQRSADACARLKCSHMNPSCASGCSAGTARRWAACAESMGWAGCPGRKT